MARSTNHTVLVKVTSQGSGGRAEILCGHSALIDPTVFTDVHLTSRYFKRYEVGTLLVAGIQLSGGRRYTVYASPKSNITSVAEFQYAYDKELRDEHSYYVRIHGGPQEYEAPIAAEEAKMPDWPTDFDEPTEWKTKVYIKDADRKLMTAVHKLAAVEHQAVMMIGPSGYGKTTIPFAMAEEWGMDVIRWDCAQVRDTEEFFGYRGAKDGSTLDENGDPIFIKTAFTKAVEKGNVVVILDELNRIDPYISNALFPLLDHAGETEVAGYDIKLGPNVIFFATINMGYQFTGTFELDAALTNRFIAKIVVDALPEDVEAKIIQARGGVSAEEARRIVKLMTGLRGLNNDGALSLDASTRVSLALAKLVGAGLDLRTAVVYSIINGISDEEAKLVIDRVGYVLS